MRVEPLGAGDFLHDRRLTDPMMSTPKDDYGDRHVVGAPGCLFIFGAALPTLWAIWVIIRIGVANSTFWGQRTENPTYPRDMTELWVTAAILTLTAITFIGMELRYSTARRAGTVVLAVLTVAAAIANWMILMLP
ncbi:hypothetical protein PX701_12780 [Agromyces sp. H3Y2-19a]|uniref:hypothetical protein n=1 Tax=Agromyces TaxID=33877 RepID=UPI0023B948E0|nr:hypothetical protein [Agromyces chromiiresistens]MDF0514499.1 hypothetical protein [Agromyces chromiiresistens]